MGYPSWPNFGKKKLDRKNRTTTKGGNYDYCSDRALSGVFCLFVVSQTEKLGMNVYFSEEGTINLAFDATMAAYNLDKAYVPFILFMGTDPKLKAVVHRDGVILIHKDKEYHMPGIPEFRKKYRGENRDLKIYSQFGKKNLVTPKMHHLRFQSAYDFFPQKTESTRLVDEIEITV
jgi:hypothetical protein